MDKMGRAAESPWAMPLPAWKKVLWRAWNETSADNVGLISAGVAFYGFLAIVPLLGSVVLLYGLFVEPSTVIENVRDMTAIMPADVASVIGDQLMTVVQTSDGKKGLGLVLALALALFGARSGAGAVITALNIAYEEDEKRSFIHVNLLAIATTFAAVIVAIMALIAVASLGHLQSLFPYSPDVLIVAGKIGTYAVLGGAGAGAAATLYRFGGPVRANAPAGSVCPSTPPVRGGHVGDGKCHAAANLPARFATSTHRPR